MNIIGYFIFIFLVFVVIPLLIGRIIYIIPKRMGYVKIAKWLTYIYVVVLGIFALTSIFEDELFSRSDALIQLKELNIDLVDEFDLTHNESTSGIGDYYHTFSLSISIKDKEQIIQLIKSDKHFKSLGEPIADYRFDSKTDRYNGPMIIQNYETRSSFVRELFKPNGANRVPTFYKITIDKTRSILTFEDIDD